jgi:hypothetical protein
MLNDPEFDHLQSELNAVLLKALDLGFVRGRLEALAELDGQRATQGSVQQAVQSILSRSPVPLGPLAIVKLARKQGQVLKESSVRMALHSLRDKGRAERADRQGKGQSTRHRSGAESLRSTPTLLSVGETETHLEEVNPA